MAARDDWEYLVGSFILAFGEIELATFFLWERYFPGQSPPANFKERAGKVCGPAKDDRLISPCVPSLLAEALRIADSRNAVAHHPLSVQVFRHTETGLLSHTLGIASRLTDLFITDVQLLEMGERTRRLAEELRNAIWRWNEDDA